MEISLNHDQPVISAIKGEKSRFRPVEKELTNCGKSDLRQMPFNLVFLSTLPQIGAA
jgi:hypothetical protein